MKKTDKKVDNAIIDVLTEVCDIAQENYNGFKWITHFANYNDFPDSLSVVCVYDTNEQLEKTDVNELRILINEKLLCIDVNIKDICRQVSFDTEENCSDENNGNWNERFK
jgi:hypothetical protein